jgi:hypothetical protein
MIKKIIPVVFLLMVSAGAYQAYQFFAPKPEWHDAIAAAPDQQAESHVSCSHYNASKNAYFGDLHVHTALSWDGVGRGMLTSADDAYRFARGEEIKLPPYAADGEGTRAVKLDRPLDFAAVTDHAESIGEVYLCLTPASPAYDSDLCRRVRGEKKGGLLGKFDSPMMLIKRSARSTAFCGDNLETCREATVNAWLSMQEAADRWYDRSEDCRFTTFNGYEHSFAPKMNRAHRNVIFRNEVVPELPVSAHDEAEAVALWRRLKKLCLDTDGDCDVLTIPHNPNHSAGTMFPSSDPATPLSERQERARLSAALEPLVEMMQIKGESECRNGLSGVVGAPDEFCSFEKYSPPDFTDCEDGTGMGFSLGYGCVARTDFARYAVAAGLAEKQQLGVNPYKLGFIGSTDTHNGSPGDVEENNFVGSRGLKDNSPQKRLKQSNLRINPGGLVGVWATENTRDAIFDSMRQREVFATSGPRMTVRFFASWEGFASSDREDALPWCEQTDAIATAYRNGVAMGGELEKPAGREQSPFFAIQAQRDPGTVTQPGGLLQRLQIVKVIALANGAYKQQVYEVAGDPDSKAGVDTGSCKPYGEGMDTLCTVWQDPDFDAEQSAAYYARVIENPSCRWNHFACLENQDPQIARMCADSKAPKTVQERAWSSPIWYSSKP